MLQTMDLKEIQTDLKETTNTDLKETQSTDSKRNSNHGLKRKTTETKRDRRWACGAQGLVTVAVQQRGTGIDEEDSGGKTWRSGDDGIGGGG